MLACSTLQHDITTVAYSQSGFYALMCMPHCMSFCCVRQLTNSRCYPCIVYSCRSCNDTTADGCCSQPVWLPHASMGMPHCMSHYCVWQLTSLYSPTAVTNSQSRHSNWRSTPATVPYAQTKNSMHAINMFQCMVQTCVLAALRCLQFHRQLCVEHVFQQAALEDPNSYISCE